MKPEDKEQALQRVYLIHIAGMLPEVHVSCDQKSYPLFLAYRPLSNKPLSGTVNISPLDDTGEISNTGGQLVSYADVDIDKWAERFLEDVENLLATSFGAELSAFTVESIEALISAKEKLAAAISTCLIPVEKGATGGTAAQATVKDRLLKNLVAGSKISCAAEYQITQAPGERKQIRLVADIKNTQGDAATYTIGECKIDLSQKTCALIISAQSAYQSGFSLGSLDVSIRDIEYDIKKMERGYETSKWLRLLIPLAATEGRISVDFHSDIDAPNPLRNVPQALKIINQTCEPNGEKLYHWRHTVNCLAFAAEQDSHELTIKYTDESQMMFKNSSWGLFEWLAQYDHVRAALLKNIHSGEAEKNARQASFSAFASLANSIANVWRPYNAAPRLEHGADFSKNMLNCAVSVKDDALNLSSDREDLAVTAQTHSAIKDGSDYEFALIVDKLVIYNSNIAETSVRTTRNSNILGGIAVEPAFIYQTELTTMPKFPASIDRSDEIVLERGYNGINETNMESALEDMALRLGLNESMSNMAKVVVWYSYCLGGTLGLKAQLPVAYYPNIALDFAGIARDVCEWCSQMKPSPKDAALTFDITVYNHNGHNQNAPSLRGILHINMLTVRFALE